MYSGFLVRRGGVGSYLRKCSRIWRMTLWSSMSAIIRISFPRPVQHSGSDSYTCLMSFAQEARARTILGSLLDEGKSVALRGTSLLEGRLTPGAITPGAV